MKRQHCPLPLYVENGTPRMTSIFLTKKAYAEATRCLVLLCADVLIVNKRTKTFFLATRKSRPAKDCLWFIGGRRKFGEQPFASAARCFKRETGLRIAPERFQYVISNEYFFADCEQRPQSTGTHSVALTFYINLTKKEIARIKLDQNEYHNCGLREFLARDLSKRYWLPHPIGDVVRKVFKQIRRRKARR